MIMKKGISSRARAATVAASLIALAGTSAAAKNWGEWSTPLNIERLPGSSNQVNSVGVDGCASHSADGLSLVFNSNRAGNQDLYVATRASTSEGFGAPVLLPAPINGPSNDACPTFGPGNRLYFNSDRDDPSYDIYVSKRGPHGWSEPENLGPNINTPSALD